MPKQRSKKSFHTADLLNNPTFLIAILVIAIVVVGVIFFQRKNASPTEAAVAWTEENISSLGEIFDLDCTNPSVCFAVGQNNFNNGSTENFVRFDNTGAVLASTSIIGQFGLDNLLEIEVPDDSASTNFLYVRMGSGQIFRSENNGDTWIDTLYHIQTGVFPGAMDFVSSLNGYVISESGGFSSTVDKGVTFTAPSPVCVNGCLTRDIDFVNTSLGFVIGNDFGFGPTVYRTPDGGTTWNPIPLPVTNGSFDRIHMVNASLGFVIGTEQNNLTFESFGRVFRTIDGGSTWQLVFTLVADFITIFDERIIDIDFVDANIGYVMNSEGFVFGTTNGGDDWIQERAPGLPLLPKLP